MDQADLLVIHRAVLTGDVSAPRRLQDRCLKPLYRLLDGLYPGAQEDDLIDSAVDALIEHLKKPDVYDPAKGSLWNFLIQVATRRMIDRLRRRYGYAKIVAAAVEDAALDANNSWDAALWTRAETDPKTEARVAAFLVEVLPDPTDQLLWAMHCDGPVSTPAAVAAMHIEHLTEADQRVACKRALDRIKRAVARAFWRRLFPDSTDRALAESVHRYNGNPPVADCAHTLGIEALPFDEQERIVRNRIAEVKAMIHERFQDLGSYL